MSARNYYEILEVSPQASQAAIKQAYRRLVKQFHPDTQKETADPEYIILLNAAYEVLSNPDHRRVYNQEIFSGYSPTTAAQRQRRNTAAHNRYQDYKKSELDAELHLKYWFREVYHPVNRLIQAILQPLDQQIDDLSADPFDDLLIEEFQNYLTQCRDYLGQAHTAFTSQPNPAKVAQTAAHLYYCLNQIGDGLNELEWFTLNYDEHYLHAGQEMFRIAQRLCREAKETTQGVKQR